MNPRKCQPATATPAKPGVLPLGIGGHLIRIITLVKRGASHAYRAPQDQFPDTPFPVGTIDIGPDPEIPVAMAKLTGQYH
jgi:hypothetical protein